MPWFFDGGIRRRSTPYGMGARIGDGDAFTVLELLVRPALDRIPSTARE